MGITEHDFIRHCFSGAECLQSKTIFGKHEVPTSVTEYRHFRNMAMII